MADALMCAVVACVLAVSVACAAPQADYYVSPAGDDGWSGTIPEPNPDGTDGPFATIERARDAAREVTDRPLTVLISDGRYRLRRPLRFGPEDSREDAAPITFAAVPGEKPVFSGGRTIHGWREGVDPRTIHFVTASSASLAYANTGLGSLDVSDHRLLPGHDADLPGTTEFVTFDAGDAALIESPFFSSTASWYVGWAFHLDDIEVPTPHRTVHQVWMR